MLTIFLVIYTISIGFLCQTLFNYKLQKKIIIRKGITSSLFVIIALAFSYHNHEFYGNHFLLIAVLFYFISDLLLGLDSNLGTEFKFGIITFSLGHLFMAFYLFNAFTLTTVYIATMMLFVTVVIERLFRLQIGKYRKFVYPYSFIVSLITFKAIFNYLDFQTTRTLLQAIGFSLFLISDSILLFNYFSNHKQATVKMLNWITSVESVFMLPFTFSNGICFCFK